MPYDLVIKNGTVIDGSGLPRYRADVAVLHGDEHVGDPADLLVVDLGRGGLGATGGAAGHPVRQRI